jgi:hypothetical protein
MAKQRLFPEPPQPDDSRNPHERFEDLAIRIVNVPKSEIEKREKKWHSGHLRKSVR